jgi:PAS domain S-box-containing protein
VTDPGSRRQRDGSAADRASIQTIILDSITEGVFTIDKDFRITSFNAAAEAITGTPRAEAVGRPCREILRASICEGRCALEQTMRTGRPVIGKQVTILDARGGRKPLSVTTALLRDVGGGIVGGVETFRDLTMIEQLRRQVEKESSFEDILSRSHLMKRLFDILPDVSESGSTVLLEGESGTGKELFARAIHALSGRRKKPFVAVNCAALPDTLLESELFGYRAGAFTDARRDTPGRIARAEGGTLFLDEIGDVSSALQVRLLRFLQERTYEPLGAMEPVAADVRVIAATNRHLADRVREGAFREDLYYRVNVVCLTLPPLRDRMEDIPLLADHFISRLNRLRGKDITGLTDAALECLMGYRFPGNVRELENIVERAFILCRSGPIDRHHLPEPVCGAGGQPAAGHAPAARADPAAGYRSFRAMEQAFLRRALERNGGNRLKTARELGIHKTTLYRKMKSLGVELPRQVVQKRTHGRSR